MTTENKFKGEENWKYDNDRDNCKDGYYQSKLNLAVKGRIWLLKIAKMAEFMVPSLINIVIIETSVRENF